MSELTYEFHRTFRLSLVELAKLRTERDALKLELSRAQEAAIDLAKKLAVTNLDRDRLLILCGKMRAELVKLNSGWTVGPYRELLQQANEVLGEVRK